LQPGPNAVAVQLGDGWYSGRIGMSQGLAGKLRGVYGRKPRFLMQIVIEGEDGARRIVATDNTWRSTTEGPIRASDILDGETYDARRETPGWDHPGFNDSGWESVKTVDESVALVAQPNEPISVVERLSPATLTAPRPGIRIADMGQNMVGWVVLTVQGKPGQEVTVRYGERLNDDGTLYTENLRGAPQTDRFILAGTGKTEVLRPHFTYHGFRYVEITDLGDWPSISSIEGEAFRSAAPEAGAFTCSDPMVNRLWQNIVWTQRANMFSVPTDCPQRDERLGWQGDVQAFSQTAAFAMDMAAFYTKIIQDMRDAQQADGRFSDFAPNFCTPRGPFSGSPAWADAGVLVPWTAYVAYGDQRLIEEHYDAAAAWVDYVWTQNPDFLWRNARGNDYGDWLNADTLILDDWPKSGGEIPKEVFATAFFARSAETVGWMAAALGKQEEAQRFGQLAADIRTAFNRAYVKEDGTIEGDTQAGYALALHFDLLPAEQRASATEHLLQQIDRYGGHVSTGIQSTHRMLLELTRNGRNDAAYKLLLNRTVPSWGFMIDQGATTIWERWDGYVPGRGFQNPGMNSFNHWAFGSVGEWLFRAMVGIEPDPQHPGFARFTIHPYPGPGINAAEGSYRSVRGLIAAGWKQRDGTFSLDVTVPPNTEARVYVPASDARAVTESGAPAAEAEGVAFLEESRGRAVFCVRAGTYRFQAPFDPGQ